MYRRFDRQGTNVQLRDHGSADEYVEYLTDLLA